MKKELEPYDEVLWCIKCNNNTLHEVRLSGHERDSSGDSYRCKGCGHFQDPFDLEYERDAI